MPSSWEDQVLNELHFFISFIHSFVANTAHHARSVLCGCGLTHKHVA